MDPPRPRPRHSQFLEGSFIDAHDEKLGWSSPRPAPLIEAVEDPIVEDREIAGEAHRGQKAKGQKSQKENPSGGPVDKFRN
jgi:hypothetical protein